MLKRSESIKDFKKFIEVAKLNKLALKKGEELFNIPIDWTRNEMKQKLAHDICLTRCYCEYTRKLAGEEMTEAQSVHAQELEDNLELFKAGIGGYGFQMSSPLNKQIQESLKKTIDPRGDKPLPCHIGKEMFEINGRVLWKPTPQRVETLEINKR